MNSPGNISSRTRLGFLTAPTELTKYRRNCKFSYPIEYFGRRYKDVESAFQANKQGNIEERESLMTTLLKIRFETYPATWKWIQDQGGIDWLRGCSHIVVNNKQWEGHGAASRFIRCLTTAWAEAFVE